jgi:hypothetical protein
MKKLLFYIFLLQTSISYANHLKPFVTDYCTLFLDGTSEQPDLWKHCCLEHDIHYWYGGSDENLDKADLNLQSCVDKVAGSSWAKLIYLGVRAGHYSPIKNKHKWSWGWETKRGNTKLDESEKSYILEELRRLPYNPSFIERYINNNF